MWQKEAEGGSKCSPDWAVEGAEGDKNAKSKEDVEKRGLLFLPLAADTWGGFGPVVQEVVGKAVAKGRILDGNAVQDRCVTRKGVLQRLQVVVMRGGGVAVVEVDGVSG